MNSILLTNTYKDVLVAPKEGSFDTMTANGYEVLNGFYHVLLYIGGFGLVAMLLFTAVTLVLSNPKGRMEGKERLLSLIPWGILMFACSGVCGVIYLVATTYAF